MFGKLLFKTPQLLRNDISAMSVRSRGNRSVSKIVDLLSLCQEGCGISKSGAQCDGKASSDIDSVDCQQTGRSLGLK